MCIRPILAFIRSSEKQSFDVSNFRQAENMRPCVVNYQVSYEPASFAQSKNQSLTARQREIFNLIVVGLSNKEIARKLGLSVGTVKIHVATLFRKLGVHHRGAVALAGVKFGLRPWAMLLSEGFGGDTAPICGTATGSQFDALKAKIERIGEPCATTKSKRAGTVRTTGEICAKAS